MKFHLIGIGGAGMSVVARLLRARGHEVSGSDRADSPILAELNELGITTFVGQRAEQVPQDAIVVRSTAIKPNNPELGVAIERNQTIWHRSQALAFASEDHDFIAVAGAHGKTSTSAMIAVALGELGADPARAIGGYLAGGEPGGYFGTGKILVAEADESDGSFLNYTPRIALVTNVEPDHLDHYGTAEAFAQAFVDFAHCIVPGGLLVCCSDDPGAAQLAQQAREAGIRVATYGERPAAGDHTLVSGIRHDHEGMRATLQRGDCEVEVHLAVPGNHMILNAAGAWLVCTDLGYDPAKVADALGAFRGTGRRFELRGCVNDIRVIDDYAHHPTEVAATLRTARELTTGQVYVVFQPHLYSRTKNFAEQFAHALELADHVIVTEVYAAREEPSDGAEAQVIADYTQRVQYIPDMWQAAREITEGARPGDIILTMGAGNIYQVANTIIDELTA